MASTALTLLQLNRRIASLLSVPSTQNVWVTAELSDVNVRGGHCYMELLQKDPSTGMPVARARGIIWASAFARINADFYAATGQRFATGLQVMVCASVNYHPAYGMSLVISAVNPEFTMGDIERRRKEILRRLHEEGILDMNRSLEWPDVALRVAIVSAPGAAGYGDFINQLFHNSDRLRFTARLFPAVMQGESAPISIIAALERIADEYDAWDCVVIIRGGGATSDLVAFDNYDLAANIAQFPLPVIIGIGHERDITVLDFVANMRVKTPTAAAEWLIGRAADALDSIRRTGTDILHAVTERLSGCAEQLAYFEGLLPVAPQATMQRAAARIGNAVLTLAGSGARRIAPELARLDHVSSSLASATATVLRRRADYLDARGTLLEALSPQATLRRGYSITRIAGRAVTSVSQLECGDEIITTLADGTFTSTVITKEKSYI